MRAAWLLGLATALALPAQAESNDIAGAWSFKTNIKRKGCTITGNMTISQPSETGTRTCSFVSREICQQDPDLSWQIEQSCRVTPQAEKYIIRSTVIASLTPGYPAANYLPDHFVVTPESAARMTGIWQDSQYAAPVVFWRDASLPVS